MKKKFLNTAFALTLATFMFSCESDKKTDTDTDNADTTVVIPAQPADTSTTTTTPTTPPQDEPAGTINESQKQKPSTTTTPKQEQTQPEEPKKDWRAMLVEYHDILCRAHKGKATNEDKIRQAELSRELMIERKKLPASEQFKFAAEMARAANMETCK